MSYENMGSRGRIVKRDTDRENVRARERENIYIYIHICISYIKYVLNSMMLRARIVKLKTEVLVARSDADVC
jgi:hypothetical protein